MAYSMSSRVTVWSDKWAARPGKCASGWRPRSRTISMRFLRSVCRASESLRGGGITPSRRSRSSVISLPAKFAAPRSSSICYPRIMLVELHEEQDLSPLFERSQKEPVLIFKHSTQCSRSDAAYQEVQAFLSKHPEVPCGMVLVIEDREISDALEEQIGDRKSTRLNSSHSQISYAVFCL